jgi:hypothetical protein
MNKPKSSKAPYILWGLIGGIILLFISSSRLPPNLREGRFELEFIQEAQSPNGIYTATLYFHFSGGAAGIVATRGYLRNNATETTRLVYNSSRRRDFNIEWTSDTTVVINDTKIDTRRRENSPVLIAAASAVYVMGFVFLKRSIAKQENI